MIDTLLPNNYIGAIFYSMKVKDDFHHLIDSIEDEELLRYYYQLIQKINDIKNGHLWNNLTESEKSELLAAYDESFDPNNLLSNDEVKQQHEQWLKP